MINYNNELVRFKPYYTYTRSLVAMLASKKRLKVITYLPFLFIGMELIDIIKDDDIYI